MMILVDCSAIRLLLGFACLYGSITVLQSTQVVYTPPPNDALGLDEMQPLRPTTLKSNETKNSEETTLSPTVNNTNNNITNPSSVALVPPDQKFTTQPDTVCFYMSLIEDDFQQDPVNTSLVDQIPSLKRYRRMARWAKMEFLLFSDFEPDSDTGWRWRDPPLELANASTMETLERWVQFLPWKHEGLTKRCRVAYFVSYLESTLPRALPVVFVELARSIRRAEHGLALHRDTRYNTMDDLVTALLKRDEGNNAGQEELKKTLEWMKDDSCGNDNETARNVTERWPFLQAPVYRTTFMGMDLKNAHLRNLTQSFWNVYAQETLSVYDALLFSYFIHKHHIQPYTNLTSLDGLFHTQESRIRAPPRHHLGRLLGYNASAANFSSNTKILIPKLPSLPTSPAAAPQLQRLLSPRTHSTERRRVARGRMAEVYRQRQGRLPLDPQRRR